MSESNDSSSPNQPSDFGAAGSDRGPNGRFVPGNRAHAGHRQPGSKYARQVREILDEVIFVSCTRDRLLAAFDAVLRRAEAGDWQALKLIVERCAGPAESREVIERLEALEELMRSDDENGKAVR